MYLIKRRLRSVPCHAGRRKTTNKKKKPSHSKKPSLLKRLLALRSSFLKFSRLITRRINRLADSIRRVANETELIRNQVNQVNTRVNVLAADVSAITAPGPANETGLIQEQVNLLNTRVNALAAEVSALTAPIQSVRALLQARIGTTATIETDAGSISGTVLAVGIDFVQILEPTGDIVLIPLSSITTIE
jgi:prefoldin subunit 5